MKNLVLATAFAALSGAASAQEAVVLPSPGWSLPERAALIVGGCSAGLGAFAAAAGAAFPISVPVMAVSVILCSIVVETEVPE